MRLKHQDTHVQKMGIQDILMDICGVCVVFKMACNLYACREAPSNNNWEPPYIRIACKDESGEVVQFPTKTRDASILTTLQVVLRWGIVWLLQSIDLEFRGFIDPKP